MDDREVDLNLVEPTGVDRGVDENKAREPLLEAGRRDTATMRAAIIDDPENTPGVIVGRPRHDLLDEAEEGHDAGGGFATANDGGAVNIEGGEVGPSAAAHVLVLDTHDAVGSRG